MRRAQAMGEQASPLPHSRMAGCFAPRRFAQNAMLRLRLHPDSLIACRVPVPRHSAQSS